MAVLSETRVDEGDDWQLIGTAHPPRINEAVRICIVEKPRRALAATLRAAPRVFTFGYLFLVVGLCAAPA
jgi:hypothetical protein